MISRRWFYAFLLTTGMFMLACPNPTYARSLKDIRIGEHDHFTRIVFESNADFAAEKIVSSTPGQLTVVFPDTQAAFVRKIPVDRSPQIDRIQLLSRKSRLAITLHFNNPHARFDTFGLTSPPRMVLDIFWPLQEDPPVSDRPENQLPSTPDDQQGKEIHPSAQTESSGDNELGKHDYPAAVTDIENNSSSFKEERIKAGETRTAFSKLRLSAQSGDTTRSSLPQTSSAPNGDTAEGFLDPGDEMTSRSLQYYLVIALVVITIGILFLLVFMLMFRHQWGGGKGTLKTNEFLEHQDKRIESIDAQVQEQLKRYDEV